MNIQRMDISLPSRFGSVLALLSRRRFQLVSALIVAGLVPFFIQISPPPTGYTAGETVGLAANCAAVVIAFWMRLSIEIYPGIRRSSVIVPTVLAAHGISFATLLVTRLPYGRISLLLGVLLHVGWLYFLFLTAERRARRRIAVVPAGDIQMLATIPNIEWHFLKRPRLNDARTCDAIVADFSGNLSGEWQAFLADAALAGRIVYQRKQLSESLSGRVELEHLSENTFGSLLPSRGYLYIKASLDFLSAVALLPVALPVMAITALLIILEDGGSPLFRQKRVGYAGREFTVLKFRTMRRTECDGSREAVTTAVDDTRITKLGRILRKYRLDEIPQIFNILRFEMSWIGPRPEADVLSRWYRDEIPFYLYRHVVKPGISGWAQVNQGHVATIDEVHKKLQFDFYYIKYFSPWLDLLILLRTFKTILTGYGSK